MALKIYGIHDSGCEDLNPSWVVQSFDVRETPYWHYLKEPRTIARLNWSHTGGGTIPEKRFWVDFASLCASFVSQSRGVSRFIIGNEPNHPVEQIPGGTPLTPEFYADCYRLTYGAIKDVAPDASLMPAAIAPWAVFSGIDWIEYFERMLHRISGKLDAVALHAYTRGYSLESVTSNSRMDSPYGKYYNGFRTFWDFMNAIPLELRELPVHITEMNGDGPWPNENRGYVQALYEEVNRWNVLPDTQKIHSASLFRWWRGDEKWQFETKEQVHADFREAVAKGYTVPKEDNLNRVYLPIVVATEKKREWDERLTERGVTIETPALSPGEAYWKVVRGRWMDESESQGRHHIYVDVLNTNGQRVFGVPVVVTWPNGAHSINIDKPVSEDYGANFPMSPSRNEYSVKPVTELPAERVTGIGMGADSGSGFNAAAHTSTAIVWQLTQSGASELPENYVVISAPAGANIRQEPSLEATILGALPVNTALPLLGKTAVSSGEWYEVDSHWGNAWVHSSTVRVVGDAEDKPSPTIPAPTPVEISRVIDPLLLLAFLQVESGNAPFHNGLLIIRFEVHRFKDFLDNDTLFNRHFRFVPRNYTEQYWRPNEGAEWRLAHGSMENRHQLLSFARSLDNTAALNSTGMGLGQVMGHNARRVGFSSPQEMFDVFSNKKYGANAQLVAFMNYILSDSRLVDALRRRDLFTAVQLYNGVGQEDYYVKLLNNALNELQSIIR